MDRRFWETRLEVCTDDAEECVREASGHARWVAGLGPRLRGMLADRLEVEGDATTERVLAALEAMPDVHTEVLLVEQFTIGKRERALVDVARLSLDALTLARCERGAHGVDRRALAWALYTRNPENLELVFHLDRVHRRGFRKLMLEDTPPIEGALEDLTVARVNEILDAFEQKQKMPRASRCAQVLQADDRTMIFVRRDHMRALYSKGVHNCFAFRREWIILCFEEHGQVLRLASTSNTAPEAIAEAIAAEVFRGPARYARRPVPTPTDRVRAFLQAIAQGTPHLHLVEVTIARSCLVEHPRVTLSVDKDRSLGSTLECLSTWTGTTFADVDNVVSLRILAFGKRVLVHLTPEGGDIVLSYSDSTLVFEEREAFERLIQESFGLVIQPTEKSDAA